MPLCSARTTRWNFRRRKCVRFGVCGIVAVGKNNCAGDCAVLERAFAFFGSAVLVFRQKLDAAARYRAFQLVSIKIAFQLFSVLLQQHSEIEIAAKKIGTNNPAASQSRLGSFRRFICLLPGEAKRKK